MLELLLGAVSVKPGQFAAQRAANCTAVAMAALAGLAPLVRRSRSEGGAADKVAGKVLQLASCMLEDQVRCTLTTCLPGFSNRNNITGTVLCLLGLAEQLHTLAHWQLFQQRSDVSRLLGMVSAPQRAAHQALDFHNGAGRPVYGGESSLSSLR